MQQPDREITGSESSAETSLENLVHEHRMLDEQVTDLTQQQFLSPEQMVELSRLKKEKLWLKDRIVNWSNIRASA